MKLNNRITRLFNIEYPIIQGGMVWASGWELVSAVSNCGGLGLLGAGSMKAGELKEQIRKVRNVTLKPFGINLPLLRKDISELINVVIEEKVEAVFTSAGHPAKHIDLLKNQNIIIVHVVSSLKQALKAQEAGCDAVVGEGFEAGGHNGTDEITTISLIPVLSKNLKIPVIAAGGIVTGEQFLASLVLGAEGVQIGTAFAATKESSIHENYKNMIIDAGDNSTFLAFRNIAPVRLLKNIFAKKVIDAEKNGVGIDELTELLGNKREKIGMCDGDVENGMFEAGQGIGLINNIFSVPEYIDKLLNDYNNALTKVKMWN